MTMGIPKNRFYVVLYIAQVKCTASNNVQMNSIIFIPSGDLGTEDGCSACTIFSRHIYLSLKFDYYNNKLRSSTTICFRIQVDY